MAETPSTGQGMIAYLQHGLYDEADCGHIAFLVNAQGEVLERAWTFDHPSGQPVNAFIARVLHREWPKVTIDYEQCYVSDD